MSENPMSLESAREALSTGMPPYHGSAKRRYHNTDPAGSKWWVQQPLRRRDFFCKRNLTPCRSNLRHDIRTSESQVQDSPSDFSVVLDQINQDLGQLILACMIQKNCLRVLFFKAHNITSPARTIQDGNQSRFSY